ncbi:condensin subunit YCG1 ASCRUDRAFT_78219 [Ascoidea rubescens DSM 1968]|uniref:Nuclear condensin complex subunit 3 C-terminal domain-containing protein n=1 Tax=Ascoidea rubescens DSM 1968 TaxID=1344418 RepID=A0A1D2V8X8_9ASCO|nr:hypothetical protein ASCRUDRAFT_78219 [Ascoidea rubescens DSM 1968]ODV58112.1 hypothetical protein ASCRUDRAFT_78219 [Ascoidea rubescens DSM 1968]
MPPKNKNKFNIELNEASDVHREIANVFQDCQLNPSGFKRNATLLKLIQKKAFESNLESSFNLSFTKLINKVLPVKKSEIVGDRIIKLTTKFIMEIKKDEEKEKELKRKRKLNAKKKNNQNNDENNSEEDHDDDDDEEEEEEDTLCLKFISYFLRHLLRGIDSKDKNVRYRIIQLLGCIVTCLEEIDNELYNNIIWNVQKRLCDKEPNIRLKAVLCISRFQGDEDDEDEHGVNRSTAKLLSILQNDPSPEVRRAALLNIDKSPLTLPYLVERAKDLNTITRKMVYSRIMKEVGDFRKFEKTLRENLLLWGLKDREQSVRNSAIKMFTNQWLSDVNNNLLELIERLHIINSEVAPLAMKYFFQNRSDIVSNMKLDKKFWGNLNAETAFLARTFFNHCQSNNLQEYLEKSFPEAAEFATLISKYFTVRKKIMLEYEQNDPIFLKNINTSNNNTFQSYSNIENELDSQYANDLKEINFIMEQLLTIAKDYDFSDDFGRREMLQVLRSSLTNDKLTDVLIKYTLQTIRKLSISENDFCQMMTEIVSDIRDTGENDINENDKDQDKEKDDEDLDDENGDKSPLKSGSRSPSKSQKKNVEEIESPDVMIQCLYIVKHMLELTRQPLENNIPVSSLLDSIVTTSIRSQNKILREIGIHCLGLGCLLDKQLTIGQLRFFGLCCAKAPEKLQIICLKIIFDILATHGTSVLDIEGNIDTLSMNKLFYRTLKRFNKPKVQALSAEGLCKLYLADILVDEELFETLILAYYNYQNSKNQDLLQALTFCLPVYAFSHPKHQKIMASVAADAFYRLLDNYDEFLDKLEPEDMDTMVEPQQILQNLIHWTNPQNIVNSTEEEQNKSTNHLMIILDLLNGILSGSIDNPKYRKIIIMNLSKFYLAKEINFESLKELNKLISAFSERVIPDCDGISKNSFNKFKTKFAKLFEEAEELNNDKETEKETDASQDSQDQEYVSAFIKESEVESPSKENEIDNHNENSVEGGLKKDVLENENDKNDKNNENDGNDEKDEMNVKVKRENDSFVHIDNLSENNQSEIIEIDSDGDISME